MKFSVIIPVYNVGEYLNECVDSVLKQNFQDSEIILVNDGSTDNSAQICDDYSKKFDNIIVIHKKNGGLSSARNVGIKVAKGDWLVFLDSDDYFESSNFLRSLANVSRKTDVIIYGCTQFDDFSKKILRYKFNHLTFINKLSNLTEQMKYLNNNNQVSISAWTHACRRLFLIENNIYFDESVKVGEDIDWFFRIMISRPSLFAIDSTDYMYRVRSSSLSNSTDNDHWQHRYEAIKKSILYLNRFDGEFKHELFNYLSYQYILLISEIAAVSSKRCRDIGFRRTEEFRYLLNFHYGSKFKLVNLFLKSVGVRNGACFISKIRKF